MLKSILNFAFEKAIPTLLEKAEQEIPNMTKRVENHKNITPEKLEEFYQKREEMYDFIDKAYDTTERLNDKVNNSEFFNK